MKHSSILLCFGLVMTLANAASATVIEVSGFQVINGGSSWNASANLFDAQPSSDPVAGDTSTFIGANWSIGAQLGVDFGTDYTSKTFTNVYMLQGAWGTADAVVNYYWSDDMELDVGDVAAPNLNLWNYDGYGNSSEGRWELEYENTAGITPQARYLIGDMQSGNSRNFAYEVAFVYVPEPATMGLIAVGSMLLLRRRRHP